MDTQTATGNVVAIDPHKRVHHAAVLDARGRVLASAAFTTTAEDHQRLVAWADGFGLVQSWAIEGTGGHGRHLARYLTDQGRAVRDVAPHLTARGRRRGGGKSDRIDAVAIGREALANPALPAAFKQQPGAGPDELREQLVVLNRARKSLVKIRVQLLTEAEPLLTELPPALRDQLPASRSVKARLRALPSVDAAADDPAATLRLELLWHHRTQLDALAERERDLLARLAALLERFGTTLPSMPGISVVSAAELLAEVGDIRRFTTAGFARYNGTAPIPASSAEHDGRPVRHRLNRGGNRKLNALLHRMAMTQLRTTEAAQQIHRDARTRGHTAKEAMRVLKRNLSNAVYRQMLRDERTRRP